MISKRKKHEFALITNKFSECQYSSVSIHSYKKRQSIRKGQIKSSFLINNQRSARKTPTSNDSPIGYDPLNHPPRTIIDV